MALEDIAQEQVADVLPSLHSIDLPGQRASSVEKFITARQLSGRPVIVVDVERERAREGVRTMLERAEARDRDGERGKILERGGGEEEEKERKRKRRKEIRMAGAVFDHTWAGWSMPEAYINMILHNGLMPDA